ncbi:MAG: MBL fold metallo-hydrolase [Bacteroidetes bacterium]|nr:MBL fold metallo-hydrolase [Bacteroidales bacterium]NJO68988.1 MBL fold metallo-hydrolase [Bacteroidota bacterium]
MNLKQLIFAVSLAFLTLSNSYGQGKKSSWFKAYLVADNVWRIDDNGADNMYLVAGKDTAMLIDNGLGVANIRDFVKTLTSLPLIVIITHGHPDHAGGNYQFKEVYIHPADMKMASVYGNIPKGNDLEKMMTGGAKVPKKDIFNDTLNHQPTQLKPITDGYIFKLGDRDMEVISVPGHTYGEVVLLDKQNKILFTGDNNNDLVWLHIPGTTPLETYLASLEKLNSRIDEFNILMPGHGIPVESSFIAEQIMCVKSILNGSCKSKDYTSFAGNGKICTYKRATVAYNPDNLRE